MSTTASHDRWFQPVHLPPDEPPLLLERESLKVRGLSWAGFFIWGLVFFSAWITILIVQRGWGQQLQDAVRGLFLVLIVTLLPAFFVTFINWLLGGYTVTGGRIWREPGLVERVRTLAGREPARPRSMDLREVTRVRPQVSHGPGGVLDVGQITLLTSDPLRTFVLNKIEHPDSVADQLRRHVAADRGRPVDEGDFEANLPEYYRMPHSFSWWALNWVPASIVVLVLGVAWGVLGIASGPAAEIVVAALEVFAIVSALIVIPLTIISFIEWWYRVYIVTERRVIMRQGLLNVIRRDLALEDVVSATVTTSGINQYLDVGYLQVQTAGRSGNIVMRDISAPNEVRRLILETQERHRHGREQLDLAEMSARLDATLYRVKPAGTDDETRRLKNALYWPEDGH